jgi:hypothetical protein
MWLRLYIFEKGLLELVNEQKLMYVGKSVIILNIAINFISVQQ